MFISDPNDINPCRAVPPGSVPCRADPCRAAGFSVPVLAALAVRAEKVVPCRRQSITENRVIDFLMYWDLLILRFLYVLFV
jgi:hypothetical protein